MTGLWYLARRDFLKLGVSAAALAALGAGAPGLAGCASSSASPGVSGASASNGAAGTVSVTDCAGREVNLPAFPQRISVMDSFAGELAVMIGAGPCLVGVPGGVASDEVLRQVFPGLASLPAPMQNGSVNMEEFMAAQPDVAIVKRDVYEAGGQARQLDSTGVPYVVVGYETMREQIAMMRLVGRACGDEPSQRAEALASLYETVIDDCARRAVGLRDDQKARVYHAINALTMTDGAQSLGADWVAAVGCVDVSAEHAEVATETDFTTTLEQIAQWDPDAFVCNSADTVDYLLSKDACASLRAVKEDRCYTIPVGATRWGQRGSVETYLAMLWLGATMYPERYADFDLKGFVVDYYRDYLGVAVTDEMYDMMLAGRGLRQASADAQGQK